MLLVNELPPQHSCKLDVSKKTCHVPYRILPIRYHIYSKGPMSHLLGGVFELKAQNKKRFGEDLVEHITMQGSLPICPVCGEIRNQRPFRLVLVPSTGMDFCTVSLVSHRLWYSPVLLLSVLHWWNKIPRLESFQGQHLHSFITCILKFPPLPHITALGTRVPTHDPSGHNQIISKPQHGLNSDEMVPHGRVNLKAQWLSSKVSELQVSR